MDESLKNLTILYKWILKPLYKQLLIDIAVAECLFQGILGLSIPTRQKRADTTKLVMLYDDWELIQSNK